MSCDYIRILNKPCNVWKFSLEVSVSLKGNCWWMAVTGPFWVVQVMIVISFSCSFGSLNLPLCKELIHIMTLSHCMKFLPQILFCAKNIWQRTTFFLFVMCPTSLLADIFSTTRWITKYLQISVCSFPVTALLLHDNFVPLQEVMQYGMETLLAFLLPYGVIIGSYVCILRRIRKTRFRRRIRSEKLILAIIITFGLFWLPYHIINMVQVCVCPSNTISQMWKQPNRVVFLTQVAAALHPEGSPAKKKWEI